MAATILDIRVELLAVRRAARRFYPAKNRSSLLASLSAWRSAHQERAFPVYTVPDSPAIFRAGIGGRVPKKRTDKRRRR